MLLPFAHVATGPIDPLQPLAAALAVFAYGRRARQLASEGRPVPGWRQALFYVGVALIVVTLASPVAHAAEELLLVHMVEHLLLTDAGALMIVLGLTGPLLAPVLKLRLFNRLRVIAHPAIAFPLWALNLYLWHLPVLYQAALDSELVHGVEHIMFITFAINMWMPLFGPLPMPTWFGNVAKLLYIIGVRLTVALLANVFIWSGKVFYPQYERGASQWHIAPLTDQGVAGSVLLVEGSVLTLALFSWLFLKTLSESEKRQELLEFAAARGLE
ncbi:MAG: cytochrome c oxidase assembly protein, partial [Geminicoccales bacterium]